MIKIVIFCKQKINEIIDYKKQFQMNQRFEGKMVRESLQEIPDDRRDRQHMVVKINSSDIDFKLEE